MALILRVLRRAGQDLFTGRIFALVLLPMGLALLVWGVLFWFFGAVWKDALVELLAATPLQALAEWAGTDWLLPYAALFLLILLWLPAVYVTALLVTSLALMPVIVGQIAERDYASLARRRGGSVAGSLGNGVYALILYLVGWLLSLPLWLFGPLGALASLWLNTWLNQRLFLYDALAEHADASELRALHRQGGWQLYALSGILSLAHLIPFVGLVAPVYMGLAFGHYALERLAARRGMAP